MSKATTDSAGRSFSTHEAARLLGRTPQTVRDWFDGGKLKGFRAADGSRRVPESELRRLGVAVPVGPVPRRDIGRQAAALATALGAQLEEALVGAAAEELAAKVAAAVTASLDRRLLDAERRAARHRHALARLASASWWQRRRVLRQLRHEGLLPGGDRTNRR